MNEKSLMEERLLQQLSLAYDEFNIRYFSNSLRRVVLQLDSAIRRLGQWHPEMRCISISRDHALSSPWFRVLAVLKHEMTHQYIHEVLGIVDEAPHGPLFQKLCFEMAIESCGEVELSGGPQPETQKRLDKIRKLLSLAESPNQHEAELAAAKAREVMRKWNLEGFESVRERGYIIRQLGTVARSNIILKSLSVLLEEYFFIQAIWVYAYDVKIQKSGRVLEISGAFENVVFAEYAWHFLLGVAAREWTAHKKKNPTANRINFQVGLLQGFSEKLRMQEQGAMHSTQLVWTGDPELHRWFRKRYPRIRSMSSSTARLRHDSLEAGRSAGRNVVLRRGIHHHGNGGRLLSEGSS